MIIEDLSGCTIPVTASVRDAVSNLTESGMLLALVVGSDDRLLGVVGDGDIRRALLGGSSLDDPVVTVMNRTFWSAAIGSSTAQLLTLCRERNIQHIPLLSTKGQVVGLFIENGEALSNPLPNTVFILAGGKGVRLRPLTDELPKPMIPIGKKPILHHIIDGLKADGFVNFNISVNYLAEKITDYFGNGEQFGVSISYTHEKEPLGTAGSLSLVPDPPVLPVVVINGDVFLTADVSEILQFHQQTGAEITAGVKIIENEIPFGVVEVEGTKIVSLIEKPVRRDFVNAGVYVVEPRIIATLKPNERIDMTDLILGRLQKGRVCAFPFHEDWIDLGRPQDLQKAQDAYIRGDSL